MIHRRSALTGSMAACIGALGLAIVALAAPRLGLGAGTEFWLYKAVAVSRYELLQIALLLAAMGGAGLGRFSGEGTHRARIYAEVGSRIGRLTRQIDGALTQPHVFALWLVLAAVVVNCLLLSIGSRPILFPDSSAYLHPGPAQSVGYPLFLSAIQEVSGSLHGLVPIQLNLLLLSFGVLGNSVKQVTGSPAAGFLVAAGLMLDRYVTDYSYHVLTESLFTTLVVLHLASALRLLHTFSRGQAVWCFTVLTAATIVRPAGYSLLLAISILAFLQKRHWRAVSTIGALTVALSLLCASLVKFGQTGVFAPQSFAGINLVGQVSSLIRADMPLEDADLVRRLDTELKPFRERIERTSYPKEYWMVTAELYNPMLSVVIAALNQHQGQAAGASINDRAMRLALATIRFEPWGYVRHVAAHYYGMWWSTLDFPGFISALMPAWRQQTIERIQLISRAPVDMSPPTQGWSVVSSLATAVVDFLWGIAIATRILVLALAFVASLYGLRFLLSEGSPVPVRHALVYCAMQTHAYYLFIASVEAGGNRYSAPFEPFLITMVAHLIVFWCRRIAARSSAFSASDDGQHGRSIP
jgi:hypothetical protein